MDPLNQQEATEQATQAAPETVTEAITEPTTILDAEVELEDGIEGAEEHVEGEEDVVALTEPPAAIENSNQAPMQASSAGVQEAPIGDAPESHEVNG